MLTIYYIISDTLLKYWLKIELPYISKIINTILKRIALQFGQVLQRRT